MSKVIAVDFDGTCVSNNFPEIGETVPGCLEVLQKLRQKGHKLILLTIRSEEKLKKAIEWFDKNGIKLWGINNNPQQKSWSSSRKVYANAYIDDLNIGCPLFKFKGKDAVNWKEIEKELTSKGYL